MNDSSVFVIAEAGRTWRAGTAERDRRLAFALIDVAADARCDAVQFQTYQAESTHVPNAGEGDHLEKAGVSQSKTDAFHDLELPNELTPELEVLRPGKQQSGVHPREWEAFAGRPATRRIATGDGIHPGDWR